MNSAIIHFSDKSTIQLNEGDLITPVIKGISDGKSVACTGDTTELWNHVHDGLIPSFMDAVCESRFFYINGNHDVLYGVGSIVKIEVI